MTTHQNPLDTASADPEIGADATATLPELDRHVLERTAAHLHERYAAVADRATVSRILEECYWEMDRRATVKTFLPLLAGNFADSKLRSLGITQGIIESPLPRVLFIDDANAGRSQMAASLMLKHSKGQVTARSAGLTPAGHLYEGAVAVMAEIGIPLDHAYPKPLSGDVHAAAQHVVTLSCGGQVDHLPGKDYREWDIPSFMGRSLEDVRAMRDDLEARVLALMHEVNPSVATNAGTGPGAGPEAGPRRRDDPPLRMSA
ncbi:low molecular weight phosphatase family protein [Cellulosimicrobium funkei]|nr:low molecular weight phosphatase family protein [Cellulosimicrobium funkei]